MHSPDDKYPTRTVFEPGTSEFFAITEPNYQSGPAVDICSINIEYVYINLCMYVQLHNYNLK